VQRRIEQTDGDRQPLHDVKNLDEVFLLHRLDFGERFAAAFLGISHDHLAHRSDALGIEEHMLGTA